MINENIKGLLLLLFILSLVGGLVFFRHHYREMRISELNCETTGKILSIKPVDNIVQSRWSGNKVVRNSYIIEFQYSVNDTIIVNRNSIDNSRKNAPLIDQVVNNQELVISVRYNCQNPEHGLITN